MSSRTPLVYRTIATILTYYVIWVRRLTPERIAGIALFLLSYLILSPYPNKGIIESSIAYHPVVIAGLLVWFVAGGLYLLYRGEQSQIILFGVIILPYIILTSTNLIIAKNEGRASIFAFMHFFFVFAFFGHRFLTRIAVDTAKGYTDVVMDAANV